MVCCGVGDIRGCPTSILATVKHCSGLRVLPVCVARIAAMGVCSNLLLTVRPVTL